MTDKVLLPGETFGTRLKGAIKRAGVGNQVIADLTGVHVKTVSAWLSDRYLPEDEKIVQIAEALNVPAAWLRYGSNSPDGLLAREEPATSGFRASLAKRRLRPRLYAVVFEYLERMEKAGCTSEQIEEAERIMSDAAYSQLFRHPRRELTDDDRIELIRGSWKWISEVIHKTEGKTL